VSTLLRHVTVVEVCDRYFINSAVDGVTVLILRRRRFSTGNGISLILVESEAGKTPE